MKLDTCGVSDHGLLPIAAMLKENCTLTSLDICRNLASESVFHAFALAFKVRVCSYEKWG